MRADQLAGAKLDLWVSRALGGEFYVPKSATDPRFIETIEERKRTKDFHPSTDWRQGGPIIEREKIFLVPNPDGWAACASFDTFSAGSAEHLWQYGPTVLIAAMRSFVASKFGMELPSGSSPQDRLLRR